MSTPAPYSLADTWRLNNRLDLMLADELTEEQLAYTPNPRARNIGDQLAHLHNVRIQWLEVCSPAHAKTLEKIEKGGGVREVLRPFLTASCEAMAECIAEAEQTGKLRGAKRGVA